MKKLLWATLLAVGIGRPGESHPAANTRFFAADDARIQYTGRIDFADAKKPRFWAAGRVSRIQIPLRGDVR